MFQFSTGRLTYIFYTKYWAFAALVKYLLPKILFPLLNFQFQKNDKKIKKKIIYQTGKYTKGVLAILIGTNFQKVFLLLYVLKVEKVL